MRNRKYTFILTEIILGIIVIGLFSSMVYNKMKDKSEKIVAIMPNANESQWSAFQYGLKIAAREYSVDVVTISKDMLSIVEDENEVINQEIEKGADGIIMGPMEGENTLNKLKEKVPIIFVEESTIVDAKKKENIPIIEPNQYEIGKELVVQLMKNYNGDIKGKKIGILTSSDSSNVYKNRKKGILDALKGSGATILWSLSSDIKTKEEVNLQAQRKVDILLALDDSSVIQAAQASKNNDLYGAILYGIGNSTEAIYYLDTSWIKCLIVPDEFMEGYYCVSEIVKKLQNSFYKMESHKVSYSVVTKENLFSEENKDLLFTISQ